MPAAMLDAGDTNMNKTQSVRGYRNHFTYSNYNTECFGQSVILRSNKTDRHLLHVYHVSGTVLGLLYVTLFRPYETDRCSSHGNGTDEVARG